MSSQLPKVILYGYSMSPMFQKLRNVLLMRKIPYSLVTVAPLPPREPLLLLGITYRRIPVAIIGHEVFFDTNLIFQELERVFKSEDGFPSLLTSHTGLQEIASQYWVDNVLFPLSTAFVQADKLPEVLKEDRKDYNPDLNFEVFESQRPKALSELRGQLTILTHQLETSTTPFLLNTPSPSHIDITAYTLFAVAHRWGTANSILVLPSSEAAPEYRRAMKWFEDVGAAIDEAEASARVTEISGEEAAAHILNSNNATSRELAVDPTDPIVQADWVSAGNLVTVTPTDKGKVPQHGKLVGLTVERVSIVIQVPDSERTFVGHFPRLEYAIERVEGNVDGLLAQL